MNNDATNITAMVSPGRDTSILSLLYPSLFSLTSDEGWPLSFKGPTVVPSAARRVLPPIRLDFAAVNINLQVQSPCSDPRGRVQCVNNGTLGSPLIIVL